MTIVSMYGQITEVRQGADDVDRFLLKNPDGTFVVLAGKCRSALAAGQLSPGDQVLIGGHLRSAMDKMERGMTWIEPFYISYQATNLTNHLDTVLTMLLANQHDNACMFCPQNCVRDY